MKLTNNPNVFFSKEVHMYLCGDKELMGATTLLRKHGLMPDYSGIPDKVLEEAARKGTALHEAIEQYDNGESVMLTPFLQEYKKICQENGLKFVVNELLISDEETVASMIDGVYEGKKKDTVILVDYKSTIKIHWRSLSWQLSLYRTIFERQFPGIKVESLMVLHLDKKEGKVLGLYPVEPIPDAEVDSLLDAERNGLIYIDENAVKDASLVLPDEEIAGLVANAMTVAELKAQIKFIEEKMAEYNQELLDYMEAHNLDELAAPGGVFKRKAAYTQTRVDSKKLQEQFPAVWSKVAKEITIKGSISFKPNE